MQQVVSNWKLSGFYTVRDAMRDAMRMRVSHAPLIGDARRPWISTGYIWGPIREFGGRL